MAVEHPLADVDVALLCDHGQVALGVHLGSRDVDVHRLGHDERVGVRALVPDDGPVTLLVHLLPLVPVEGATEAVLGVGEPLGAGHQVLEGHGALGDDDVARLTDDVGGGAGDAAALCLDDVAPPGGGDLGPVHVGGPLLCRFGPESQEASLHLVLGAVAVAARFEDHVVSGGDHIIAP